jgi:hypothetical protein
MSDLLNSLNSPAATAEKPWAQEVADAGASEPAEAAPEPVAAEAAPEPPAVPDPAPEPPQAQETASEPEPEHDRKVPLKALQEERAKRAEYERQVAQYQQQLAEYQAWAAQMQQQQMGQPEQSQAEPDPETDPIGALKHAREQLRQFREMQEQQAYEQQLNMVASQAVAQFRQQAPDYNDAYNYARQSRAQELMAFGAPENAIPQILHREEMQLVDQAYRSGRNPAEVIYSFAKARGYGNRAAAPAPAPVAPPPPAAPNPALQQARQAVAASAASAGAPAAKGEISDADAVNLKGAAFDAYWNKRFGGNKSSLFRE